MIPKMKEPVARLLYLVLSQPVSEEAAEVLQYYKRLTCARCHLHVEAACSVADHNVAPALSSDGFSCSFSSRRAGSFTFRF